MTPTCKYCGCTDLHQYDAEVEACLGHLVECKRMLQSLEWEGSTVHFECPSCRASQVGGHERNCKLAPLIGVQCKK